MNKIQEEIRYQRSKWINAINKGSAVEFAKVLTDDVVWLPSRHDAIYGKGKVRTWLDKPFSELNYDYSVSNIQLRIAGDWAIEEADFKTKATTSSGEDMPLHEGHYTVLWRKSSDQWLIERYIDHSAEFQKEE